MNKKREMEGEGRKEENKGCITGSLMEQAAVTATVVVCSYTYNPHLLLPVLHFLYFGQCFYFFG